jgi:hypothetical protein
MSGTGNVEHFDYSSEQWTEIENTVAKVRSESLTEFERRQLTNAATLYRLALRYPGKVWFAARKKEWSKVAKLSAELFAAISTASANSMHVSRLIEKLPARLEKLKAEAEAYGGPMRQIGNPKTDYYQRIMFLWTDQFDGKLGYSTSENKHYGPCVRFLVAATSPVMGSAAPSEKYVPDLIDKEKQRRKAQ